MEISRVGSSTKIKSDQKNISSKKDFSQSFNFAREKRNEEQLKNMQDEIKKKGNRLAVTKCFSDVKAYKKMISEYLKAVLEYMCAVKKDISFWQTQYYITVETIDSKLKELTDILLSEEKEKLDIASTVDEITGLVLDIYK